MSVAVAAAVPVAGLALPSTSIWTAMAVFSVSAVVALMEAALVSAAVTLEEAVVVSVVEPVVASAAVVAVVSSAAAVVDSAVPSPSGPRSALPREPKSWLRDASLGWALRFGRAPRLRPRPSLHFRLRIPESK